LALCRVPRKKPSVKENTAKKLFAECFIFDTRQRFIFDTQQRGSLLSVFFIFAECQKYNTRQKALFRVLFSTLDIDNLKIIF
jgi:hypothetical protein